MQEDKRENDHYWIWLAKTRVISNQDKLDAIRQKKNLMELYQSLTCDREKTLLSKASQIIESHEKLNIHMITPEDEHYKVGMPLVTYFKGNPHRGKQIAIVGTRNPSVEGRILAEVISKQYVEKGYSINSGLAMGIDVITHQTALSLGGITQAFIAHGLDQCYPKKHQKIFDQILEKGCVYSQYEVGVEAERFRFLERNALMVHMSDEVFVVEAGDKSGALSTGINALKNGKRTLTIQGPEDSLKFAGNHKLATAGAISVDYDENALNRPKSALCALLRKKPMPFKAIQIQTNLPTNELHLQLFKLENQRWISLKADGNWYYNGW